MIRWSIDQGKKKGRAPSSDQLAFLRSAPPADAGTMILAKAYALLATCRSFIATPKGLWHGPIPWDRMDRWCQRQRYSRSTADHVVQTIAHVDKLMRKRLNAPLKSK